MTHRGKLFFIILAAAAVYLIGNDRVALWDRDEPRNAQASRQMLQSGDWVVPRFLDKIRIAKPPFSYWMQASAMAVLGDNTFAARLPSAVSMTLTLIVLGVVLSRYVDGERAVWTVLVLASSAIVIAWSAKTSLTDANLLLWITIAQICLYAILRGHATWPVVIILAIAIGIAGLIKGPVVLGFMGMTIIAWASFLFLFRGTGFQPVLSPEKKHGLKTRATLKTLVVIAIVAAIVWPWVHLVEQRAPGFIGASFARDVLQRTMEPLEQHSGPPGYYLLIMWGIYFPWSVLLPLTFVIAWRHRDDPRIQFALAAVIGPWLMLECVQTKLPHYLLPIFPPLALLTADAIVRCLRGEHNDLLTRGTRGAIAAWAIIAAALSFVPLSATWRFKDAPFAVSIVSAAAGIAYGICVFGFFHARRPREGLLAMGLGMMIAMAIAFGWYLPNAHFLRLPVCIADALRANGGGARDTQPGEVQMIAYKEPSLAFYQGGTIREQPENDFLVTHPPAEWPRWVVVREDVWDRMPAEVTRQLEVVSQCRGVAYADKGRTWTVIVARKR
jgi:4-amino-4-deoxy-L-arabinose transferase-like glycosyltransferase